ncbi:GRAM domain-containing protein 2A isoform 6-T7 [Syngnathus typhle]
MLPWLGEQCVSCSDLLQAMDECVCVYGANVLSLVQSSPPLRERVVSAVSRVGAAGGWRGGSGAVQAGRSAKELLMTLPCPSAQTVSKYNSQYHKLFQCVPKDELLMKVYSCALLRDILLQGRLYISRNWLCFYANLFGKDIKVPIPVVSVRLVKKHKTAGLVPNGLAITTDTNQKYVFVSLLSRDSVYDVLRRICTHLQVNGKSLSLKQYMEEPTLSLDEFPTPDGFPVVDEFPSVLKWRRKASVVSVSSSLPDLLGNSSSSLSVANTPFKSEQPLEEGALETDRGLLSEPVAELGQMEYQLLKFFTLLIILLILSSCYLAFRVCSLEQQLSFLSNPHLPLRER